MGGHLAVDDQSLVSFVCFNKGFWITWSRKSMENSKEAQAFNRIKYQNCYLGWGNLPVQGNGVVALQWKIPAYNGY